MNDPLKAICYLLAFILWVIAGIGVAVPRFNLIALGLSAAILPTLVNVLD